MFLFTKTVIKSDLQQILLLMCFSVYLSNKCTFSLQHFYLYFYIAYRLYAQIKLLVLWLNPLKRTRNHCTILGLVILDL